MIKKQQKWIALLVTLTFMWLLQVSTMPLNAAGTNEQAGSASVGQGPDFVEAVSHKSAPAPKKSILPVVLIGVGVVAVAAVLFLVVLKTSYDITGTWSFIFTYGSDSESFVVTFSGDKASGTFIFQGTSYLSGNYTVDGKKVTMTMTLAPTLAVSGEFTGKDQMTGTLNDDGEIWNWTATRTADAVSLNPVRSGQSKLFPK